QFDREPTLHGLLRYLVRHAIRIPVRVRGGPSRGQLEWHRPSRATLQHVLRHPSYAGAYRYGHRPTDPRAKQPGRPGTGKSVRRPDECLVLIRDRVPAYITWERFEANQARLAANRYTAATPGARRDGPSLLAGLVWCGWCGRRMVVRYGGRRGGAYSCSRAAADYAEPLCQRLSNGRPLDALVADQLLAAVEAAALGAGLAGGAGGGRGAAAPAPAWGAGAGGGAGAGAGGDRGRAGRAAVPGVRAGEPAGGPRAGAPVGGGAAGEAATRRRVRPVATGGPGGAERRRGVLDPGAGGRPAGGVGGGDDD